MVKRQRGGKFKHLSEGRIEIARDVVLFVADHLLSNLHLDVGVRLTIRILRLKVYTLQKHSQILTAGAMISQVYIHVYACT